MRNQLIRSIVLTVATVTVIAACADNSDGFEPGAPIPPTAETRPPTTTTSPPPAEPTTATNATTSSTAPTSSTAAPSTAPTTTAADTTPATDPAPTTDSEPELAETPQAPGFDFPPAALKTDPDSPNNNRAIQPDDEPILAAYFEATLVQTQLFAEWPLDPASPILDGAPFTDQVRDAFRVGLDERTQLNHVLDISGGTTSRPYVIDDDDGDPDRVIVWDCQIDATFWKDVDTGEKAPADAYPNVGPPGVEIGTATELIRQDGEWLVNDGGFEPRACS